MVNTGSGRVREAYASGKVAQHAKLTAVFRELQVDIMEVDTTQDPVPALIGFFRQRERHTR